MLLFLPPNPLIVIFYILNFYFNIFHVESVPGCEWITMSCKMPRTDTSRQKFIRTHATWSAIHGKSGLNMQICTHMGTVPFIVFNLASTLQCGWRKNLFKFIIQRKKKSMNICRSTNVVAHCEKSFAHEIAWIEQRMPCYAHEIHRD